MTFVDEILKHLPQFVACGAQSAGKSSVIRRISRIALPEDSRCCTRIATLIQLRRDAQKSITLALIGQDGREVASKTLENLSDIRDMVADYQKQALGGNGNDFVDDHSIVIRYASPDNFNLSLTDLPGFHTDNDDAASKVQAVVQKYIKMDGTLCLHVCKGDQDYGSVLGNGNYKTALY